MRVLHVFDHSLPIQDGYASRSWAILQEQIRMGWTVHALTGPRQNSATDTEESVEGMRFHRTGNAGGLISRLPVLKQFWAIWLIYRRLLTVLEQTRPDVIHAHSLPLNGVAAVQAARRFGLPVVYEVRAFWEDAAVDQGTSNPQGLRYRLSRALENHVFRRASRITAICEGLRQDIEARQLSQHPVTVIPNAVEYGRFAKETPFDAALAARHGLTRGRTLGFVGSFYDYEGLDQIIAAMPELLTRHADIRLMLVGTGLQADALRDQVQRLGLQQQVIFTGKVPFAEVERYYSVIDVLVYPRKSMRLTEIVTPLKPLEAMAQRKVFVASDVGGHRELVRHGETGILFAADNRSALVEAIDSLMMSPDLQDRLREAGLRYVRDDRNWTNSVALYASVYGDAVQQPGTYRPQK
jgi:PEP-CTERM/exosortase A-associated glycosyltransferase